MYFRIFAIILYRDITRKCFRKRNFENHKGNFKVLLKYTESYSYVAIFLQNCGNIVAFISIFYQLKSVIRLLEEI
jgi:hypothetical protein